jgi:DNA-directed RNA polymerase subunit E'/Rpb7
MEHDVLFEEKVYLHPKDLNGIGKVSIDDTLLNYMKKNLEGRCSQHGYVKPNSLNILTRSMGQLEHGRFTGNIVFHVQSQGKVYNPSNGTRIVGTVTKKNKMGLYVVYEDAIRVLVPRDLHLGNEEFEALEVNDEIEIELRKSRFQIRDQFILSVGVFIRRVGEKAPGQVEQSQPAALKTVEEAPAEQEEEQEAVENGGLLGDVSASEQSEEVSESEVEEDDDAADQA